MSWSTTDTEWTSDLRRCPYASSTCVVTRKYKRGKELVFTAPEPSPYQGTPSLFCWTQKRSYIYSLGLIVCNSDSRAITSDMATNDTVKGLYWLIPEPLFWRPMPLTGSSPRMSGFRTSNAMFRAPLGTTRLTVGLAHKKVGHCCVQK